MRQSGLSITDEAVLTPAKMAEADARAIREGTPSLVLMDRAARACIREIRSRWTRRRILVLCGPGQNGGDGWAIAEGLIAADWPVELFSAVPASRLSGAAREAAERSGIEPGAIPQLVAEPGDLVVDALFGAGLSRDLVGVAREAIEGIGRSGADVFAVDLPSGIDGATGLVRGAAAEADVTVTFHRAKPGHLLFPGAGYCGEVVVADIGLPRPETADALLNGPALWPLPRPQRATHKYARGAVLVVSGGYRSSGAARLSAYGAAKAGAGAVIVASPPGAFDVHAGHLDAVMIRAVTPEAPLAEHITDKVRAVVAGPGLGRSEAAREKVLCVLETKRPCVLDADALTAFEDDPETLFSAAHAACVLTPHEGEFLRLFGAQDEAKGKLLRTVAAAERAGATVLFKGPDTVIATPGRTPVINAHGSPWLATAGSGDVLSGVIAALLAQGMSAHDAAAAGAFLHGEAGRLCGPGLTADDLPDFLGRAYGTLLSGKR